MPGWTGDCVDLTCRPALQRSFLPSLPFFCSSCSDWSSLMATITYAMSTTLAMMAAVAPAKVELPWGWVRD